MPELTAAELIAQAKAVVLAGYPDTHLRRAVEAHLDQAAGWLKDMERLKGRDQG